MKSIRNGVEKFINKAQEIHGDKYDYSLVTDYISNKTKMKIICKNHGIFEQNYKSHITKKYGCPKCGGVAKKTTEEFIKNAIIVHGDKYDYSLVEYENNSKKVKIICKKHGVFEQQPNHHLFGQNCNICSGVKRKSVEEFILQSKEIHGDKYNYSLVEYKNVSTKVKIICPEHGIFEQLPSSHLAGHKCYSCKNKIRKEDQHLYIFIDTKYNLYKIGVSNDVKRRCRELNSRYYNTIDKNIKIIIIFEYKGILENEIHEKFKKYNIYHPTYLKNLRCDGRSEWFNFEINNCIEYIENYKK